MHSSKRKHKSTFIQHTQQRHQATHYIRVRKHGIAYPWYQVVECTQDAMKYKCTCFIVVLKDFK